MTEGMTLEEVLQQAGRAQTNASDIGINGEAITYDEAERLIRLAYEAGKRDKRCDICKRRDYLDWMNGGQQ